MIGRPKVPLVLTTPEQQALDSLAHRARTAPQVARRARIVLACARGLDNQTVAKKLRVSPQMVGRWRARFVTRGARSTGCLTERAPRPADAAHGPSPMTPPEAVELVRTLADDPRTERPTASTRTLANERPCAWGHEDGSPASGGPLACSRICTKTFTLSPDPLLVEKAARCRRAVSPPARLSAHAPGAVRRHEKAQIQALDRTQPLLPMQPGQTARHTHTYTQAAHGTTSGCLRRSTRTRRGQVIGNAPTFAAIRAIDRLRK